MARFKRNKKPLTQVVRHRRAFVTEKKSPQKTKPVVPAVNPDVAPSKSTDLRLIHTLAGDVPQKPVTEAGSQIQTAGDERVIEDAVEPAAQVPLPDQAEYDDSMAEINRLIDSVHQKVSQAHLDIPDDLPATIAETPHEFDGVVGEQEEYEVLTEALKREQEKTLKLKHELRMIREEFDREKEKLKDSIKELRKELHRTEPIAENSFFTLSKELGEALESMDQLGVVPETAGMKAALKAQPETDFSIDEFMQNEPVATETVTDANEVVQPEAIKTEETPKAEATTQPREVVKDKPPETAKKTTTKKRLLLTGAAAITALLVLSAGLSYNIMTKPAVDETLVQEYIQKQNGTVAGVQTNGNMESTGDVSDNPATTLAQTEKAQAIVPFEQTVWESLREPIFGVQFQYPANAVEIMKTDSNITLLRKSGYIFKVQLVETSLSLDEYYEQIKATSLNYEVEKTTFANKPALYLKLQDVADFPGNRYLVAENGLIYDFWYATDSSAFDSDDIKRVEYLLKTVSILKT